MQAYPQPPLSWRRRHLGLLAIVIIVAGAGAFDLGRKRPRDDGQSTTTLRLTTTDGWVEVGSYKAPLVGAKSGYLRAGADGQMNSVVLLSDEWPRLVAVLRAIRPTPSGERRKLGAISDGAAGDPTILTVSDGPDVQLSLSSPKGPSIRVVITPAEAVRLGVAASALTDKLG